MEFFFGTSGISCCCPCCCESRKQAAKTQCLMITSWCCLEKITRVLSWLHLGQPCIQWKTQIFAAFDSKNLMIPASDLACQVHPGADDDGSNSLCVEISKDLTFELEQKLPLSSKIQGHRRKSWAINVRCWMLDNFTG